MAGQRSSQNEIYDLFEKLISWRDESHKEISSIINSHNSTVKKGINDLVKEVNNLQDELSVIRKERHVLLETVENLNGEIRHLSTKSKKPSQDKEFDHNQDLKQEDCSNTKFLDDRNTCEAIRRPEIPSDQSELIDSSDYEDISDQNADEVISNTEDDIPEDFICSVCNFAFSSNENLAIHVKNVHANPDLSEETQGEDEGLKQPRDIRNDEIEKGDFPERLQKTIESKILPLHPETHTKRELEREIDHKCKKCGKAFWDKSNLRRHIKSVHNKMKDHICKECGYSASQKIALKKHIKAVHDKIKDHICKECGYAASEKFNLQIHINEVHDKIRDHVCKECGYATSREVSLKEHIKSVHDKIKDHICKECGYAASREGSLKQHIKAVHEKIKDHICKECGYAASRKFHLQIHIKAVHDKIRNHVCKGCGYSAAQKAKLKRHMDSCHGNEHTRFDEHGTA